MNNTDYANEVSSIVKTQLANANITLTKIVEEMNKVNDEKTTVQNLSNKLNRGTIKFSEILQIADLAGYEINWERKFTLIDTIGISHSDKTADYVQYKKKIDNMLLKEIKLLNKKKKLDVSKYSDPLYLKNVITKLEDDNVKLKKRTTYLENKINELFNLLSKCPQLLEELNK